MNTPLYPSWICRPCGIEHGHREPGIATWHVNTCNLCGSREVLVTEPRDFGHLKSSWVEAYKNKKKANK